jgi:hypothetical protein
VEDWEQHFLEKSERRAAKDRRKKLAKIRQRLLLAMLILGLITAYFALRR